MEPLSLPKRKLSRDEVIAGVGGSFLVHILVFAAAFLAVWSMPRQPIKPPFCTVNLVSLKDPGTGTSEPKGNPKAATAEAKPSDTPRTARASAKSGPVVPVKRLQLDEAPKRQDVPIKKLEPKEAPKIDEAAPSLAAIEKNLDKLIPKPKPVQRTASPPVETTREAASRVAAAQAASPASKPTREATAAEVPHGSPTGKTDAGAKGTTQGSTAGSLEGSSAASALVGLYGQKVREVIEREWRLINDQGLSGLKAVVEVQIRKTGDIISIQVVRPSGNSMFDDAALRAVRKAAPLPAVPEVIVQSNTKLILTFQPGQVS